VLVSESDFEEDMAMNRWYGIFLTLTAAGLLVSGGLATAQERAPGDRNAELAEARERLAEAASEVARLSSELTGPMVEMFTRRLGGAPRAMLGLNIENAEGGVLVRAVSPAGPAAAAGVEAGDLIVSIDGLMLATDGGRQPASVLLDRLGEVEPGAIVALVVRRDGGERGFEVETATSDVLVFSGGMVAPGARAGDRQMLIQPFERMERLGALQRLGPAGTWRGIELVALTPGLGAYFGTEQGLLVVRAPADHPLGLRDGDVILDIGGRTPTSPEHAMRILASYSPGETLRVGIMRERRRSVLEFELPATARR
jgi:S1-C subfamily serine protease